MSAVKFREARLRLGLTQVEYAARLGITESAVQKKEYGELRVTKRDMLAVEALLQKRAK